MEEISRIETLEGVDLNSAKAVLAFEATLLAHGKEQAIKAYQGSVSMFGDREVPVHVLPSSTIPRGDKRVDDISVPHTYVEMKELKEGIPAFKLLLIAKLAASGGAARRLIDQGGAYLNGQRIDSFDRLICDRDLNEDKVIILRSGKKRFHKIKPKN